MDCGSFWGTPLGVADCGRGNLFSRVRWWPVVGGVSRHSCNKDRSRYSSKGVESRGVLRKI